MSISFVVLRLDFDGTLRSVRSRPVARPVPFLKGTGRDAKNYGRDKTGWDEGLTGRTGKGRDAKILRGMGREGMEKNLDGTGRDDFLRDGTGRKRDPF